MLRETFEALTKVKVDEWVARLEALKTRARQSVGDQKPRLEEQLNELSMRQASARQYLWEVASNAGAQWEPVEAAILTRWNDFSGSVEAMWKQVA